jgi:hypothetical protein
LRGSIEAGKHSFAIRQSLTDGGAPFGRRSFCAVSFDSTNMTAGSLKTALSAMRSGCKRLMLKGVRFLQFFSCLNRPIYCRL